MRTADNTIEQLEKKLQKAKQTFNEEKIIKTLELLLNKYNSFRDYHKVIKTAKELYPIYERKGNEKKKAETLLILGRVFALIADYETSIVYIKEAKKTFIELNNSLKIAIADKELGYNYRNLGKYDEALVYLLSAVKTLKENKRILEKKDNRFEKIKFAESLENIGIIYDKLKQIDKSREFFLRALHMYKELNYSFGIAKNLNNLGVSYCNEDPHKSIEFYKKALNIIKKLNMKVQIALFTSNIGGVYEDLNQYDKALKYYNKALEITKETNNTKYIPYYLEFIGSVYLKKGKYDLAIKYIQQSLELSKKQNIQEQIKNNYQLLSEIYEKKKDYQTALFFYRKYSEQKDKILNKEMIEKISGLQNKYEESSKRVIELKKHNSLISTALKKAIHMDLVGNSKKIKKVLDLAMTAAVHPDTNVLILGESGTGKEIIANIIHFASTRKDHLIVAVNSSSIPETLAESEFFGHLKGSFTGALSDKTGFLELADKGTLFLDEIADTPVSLQSKLLRVLENKRIKKIGSKTEMQVDFRIIAATNKNIDELLENESFRLDLLHRINTITIRIPPLRERPADIKPLLEYFIRELSKTLKKPIPKINAAVIDKLKKYYFPGNVRELKNMVEKAMIMLK
ncbi:MAG TPA: tetratricopeptide repeat protein, partial [Candidatus Cloacimonetes bacterium]|nr:tetratricopeptide repeat protein [Candidatus Cloacimonadota bacterium]